MEETPGGPAPPTAPYSLAPPVGAPMPVADVLVYLAGTWRTERTVRDLASGAEGRFTGTTVFAPLDADGAGDGDGAGGGARGGAGVGGAADEAEGNRPGSPGTRTDSQGTRTDAAGPRTGGSPHRGLLHHESGTFVWQGTPRPAERTLRYLPGRRPGTADVTFLDGRPFHHLDLSGGSHVAHHPCAADLYRGDFTVTGPDRWRTRWRVTGPAKDLVLVTDYTRTTGTA